MAVGDNDPFVPVADAEALAARARDGRIEVYRSGHLPSLERPDEFNGALTAAAQLTGTSASRRIRRRLSAFAAAWATNSRPSPGSPGLRLLLLKKT